MIATIAYIEFLDIQHRTPQLVLGREATDQEIEGAIKMQGISIALGIGTSPIIVSSLRAFLLNLVTQKDDSVEDSKEKTRYCDCNIGFLYNLFAFGAFTLAQNRRKL